MFAGFRILRPTDNLIMTEIDSSYGPITAWCTIDKEKECHGQTAIGDYSVSVWATIEESKESCVWIEDKRSNWASACYNPKEDTFVRKNNVEGTENEREWNLAEIEK
jgi:hypothetical protein